MRAVSAASGVLLTVQRLGALARVEELLEELRLQIQPGHGDDLLRLLGLRCQDCLLDGLGLGLPSDRMPPYIRSPGGSL